jgi:hypothetical protein
MLQQRKHKVVHRKGGLEGLRSAFWRKELSFQDKLIKVNGS